ncbi:TonB-dependent receptor [Agrobacterium sp.]|uniref:TonB-dependent receptor n=1 Tax=Agrobacterium sp. TaxID=361 RepID=UPI0028A9FA2F|nr:TonB-dependent receptor [Agrobacterium sp.]
MAIRVLNQDCRVYGMETSGSIKIDHGWTHDNLNLKFAGQHVFSLQDASNKEIEGYTLFDLTGAYRFDEQNTTLRFGVHNLFDKEYNTVWGSRAKGRYGALAYETIFDYKGRGRTFAVSVTKVF